MRPVILAFAKAPRPGHVKTRLLGRLSPAQAAALHTAFVWDVLERLQELRDEADIELHTDIPTDVWAASGVPQQRQHEGDLGLKMLYALRTALSEGRPQAMVVGTDAPTLPREHLRELFAMREDVALGPTEDGGYYAISCRRVHEGMFDGVRWSSAHALSDTIAAAQRCGLSVGTGERWFDVDEPRDLARLSESGLPKHTAALGFDALALHPR